MIKLLNNKGFKWKNKSDVWFKGYLFDEKYLKTDDRIFLELSNIKTKEQLNSWLIQSNGCFSVIIKVESKFLFAVDRIRTFPIFYGINNNELTITDNPVFVFNSTNEIDKLSVLELESAAYITGKRTLYNNVYQVQAGELIVYSENKIYNYFYSDFFTKNIVNSNLEVLQQKLYDMLNLVFEKLTNSLNNRQAVVPLSGGYDSRLIATMLKKFRHPNVYTFTYGRKNNYELENSKQAAKILEFPWKFIEYNQKLIDGFLNDNVFNEYYNFAGKACSMFYMQDYFAVKYLHDNKLIDEDAVFISGHSGDAVAGSHLRKYMKDKLSKKDIINILYEKTYIQNNHRNNKKSLLKPIANFITQIPEDIPNYNVFENWLYRERQAKFIVNSANVFDFFGYEYRLPFWDADIIDFFKSVPFKYKLHENLYVKTLNYFYFEPYKISFNKELEASPFEVKLQRVKDKIKPYMPIKLKTHYLEKNDWMCYSPISKILIEDLKTKKIEYKFKGDFYTSIISKWYIEHFYK